MMAGGKSLWSPSVLSVNTHTILSGLLSEEVPTSR